jgi:LacI family transcriptional regulator
VSVQTVSRVVNEKGKITEETRRRVQSVRDQLSYRPSAAARGLVARRTHIMGLVAHDATGGLFQDTIRAAVEEASQQGYFFLISPPRVRPAEEPS